MKKHIGALALAVLALTSTGVLRADDPLDKKVADLLVQKLGDDAKTIKVAMVKGEVVLVGEVTKRSTQELCKEVALAVPGVKDVKNDTQFKDAKGIGVDKVKEEAADNGIEKDVRKAIKAELGDHAKKVHAEVVDGVASVRGTVPDAARKDLALKAAAKTTGVKQVIDLLTVKS